MVMSFNQTEVNMMNEIFKMLDANQNEKISLEDLTNIKEQYKVEIDFIMCKLQDNEMTFAEFYRIYKENIKLCSNFISLYSTKLRNLDEAINKMTSKLNSYLKLNLTYSLRKLNAEQGEEYKYFKRNTQLELGKHPGEVKIKELDEILNINEEIVKLVTSEDYTVVK